MRPRAWATPTRGLLRRRNTRSFDPDRDEPLGQRVAVGLEVADVDDQPLGDGIEHGVLVADVPVHGGGCRAERARQRAHRELGRPDGGDDLDRGVDHGVAAQRLAFALTG